MRYAILFVLGLLIGAALSAVLVNGMHDREAWPHGVMAVMNAQTGALDRSIKANRCTANDLLPKFQTLRLVANDIEPAFEEDDPRFVELAGALRAADDAALTTPIGDCKAAAATLDRVHEACSSCHREFKD